jgi:hypothetical protein
MRAKLPKLQYMYMLTLALDLARVSICPNPDLAIYYHNHIMAVFWQMALDAFSWGWFQSDIATS